SPPFRIVDRFGHAVAEEVEVERSADLLTHFPNLLANRVRRKHPAGQRPQGSATHRGDAQLRSARASHWRLDNRVLSPDQLDKVPVGPAYHSPVLGIDAHGSAGVSAGPFCNSSIEM